MFLKFLTMQIKFITLLIISCIALSSNSQTTLIAKYNFSHVRDTNNPQNIYKDIMIMTANNNASLYKSYSYHLFDSLMEHSTSNEEIKLPKGSPEQLYTNFTTQEIILIRPLNNDKFAIKTSLQKTDWELIDSTQKFGNLICKKARGKFRGRVYNCWYCPDIAVQSGPWKLNGLPGLIINATDEKKQVSFILSEIWQTQNQDVELPKPLTYITEEKFNEMLEALVSNPNAFLENNSSNQNNTIEFKQNSKVKKKLKWNNPLELN